MPSLGKVKRLRGVAGDLVNRKFHRPHPNELWVTDATEHPTREGKVYCCAVFDAFSRRIIGWSIDTVQNSNLVVNALDMAIKNRNPSPGGVVHGRSRRAIHVMGIHQQNQASRTHALVRISGR